MMTLLNYRLKVTLSVPRPIFCRPHLGRPPSHGYFLPRPPSIADLDVCGLLSGC